MNNKRKVILYIATSLDGYIAKPDDNIDFLTMVEKEGEDYGYSTFIQTVDTIIVGRKTYDKVLSMGVQYPHANKNTFVITRTPQQDIGLVKFYSHSIKELIVNLKNKAGKNIYVDGGAEIVFELLKENLIDEFYISIVPIILGDGIRLFKNNTPELKLTLVSTKHFEKGLVQLHYINKNISPLN